LRITTRGRVHEEAATARLDGLKRKFIGSTPIAPATMTNTEIFVRLLLSFICGTIIGLERQWRHKNAGLKTNTLVAVGATTFTIVAELGSGPTFLPQVAAGVVTGIGFIGGGVIMKRGASVQGINSAATLWATASIGLSIGRGYDRLALLVLAFIVFIQFVERGLANWIDRRSNFIVPRVHYTLEIRFEPRALDSIREKWQHFSERTGVDIIRYVETQNNDSEWLLQAEVRISKNRLQDLMGMAQRLSTFDGIHHTEWFQRKVAEDERDTE
jgi:putative Mg2+ transporter-C (MgtC) family protein